jgi:phytoene dehydrogenase-like protein
VPRRPAAAVSFATKVLEQGTHLWNARFRDDIAPAMLSGLFAHNISPQPALASAAAGMLLGTLAHRDGWPVPIGGSQTIVDALAADVLAHGGEIHTGRTVTTLDEFEADQLVMLDVSTDQLLRMGGKRLPSGYRRALSRFRFGPGVAKVDFALTAPVPWKAPEVALTATVHLGGSRREIRDAERQLARGMIAEHPYVLVAQPSLFDTSRAPEGMHTLWAYVHVPHGSTVDATELITAEIERYAPGFRDTVLFSHATSAAQLGEHDLNFVGGDFAAGATTLRQLVARPLLSRAPWVTPLPNVYLCSSATAPGPGVHGMAGFHAATRALRDIGAQLPSLMLTP